MGRRLQGRLRLDKNSGRRFPRRGDLGASVDADLARPFVQRESPFVVCSSLHLAPEMRNRNRPRTDRFSGMVSGIALTAEGVLKTRMKYVGVKRND